MYERREFFSPFRGPSLRALENSFPLDSLGMISGSPSPKVYGGSERISLVKQKRKAVLAWNAKRRILDNAKRTRLMT